MVLTEAFLFPLICLIRRKVWTICFQTVQNDTKKLTTVINFILTWA